MVVFETTRPKRMRPARMIKTTLLNIWFDMTDSFREVGVMSGWDLAQYYLVKFVIKIKKNRQK